MSTELAEKPEKVEVNVNSGSLMPETLDQMWRACQFLAASQVVPKDYQNQPYNILAASQIGSKLGFDVMTSVNSIYMVKGRATLSAQAMRAIVMASDKCERFEIIHNESETPSELVCTIKSLRQGQEYQSAFSMVDAIQAGLSGDNWKKYPKAMLAARASSTHCRLYYADILAGLHCYEEVKEDSTIQPIESDSAPVVTMDDIEEKELIAEADFEIINSDEDPGQLFGADTESSSRKI